MMRWLALVVVAGALVVAALLLVVRAREASSATSPTDVNIKCELVSEDALLERISPRVDPTIVPEPVAAAESSTLLVHVTDDSGRAVADKLVWLTFVSDARQQVGTGDRRKTDINGECELDTTRIDGASGPWLCVSVEEPEGYVGEQRTVARGTPRVDIVLVRGARMSGRVSYSDGSVPREGTLYVNWRYGDGVPRGLSTDVVDGAYEIGASLAGRVESLELESPRHAHSRLDVPDFDIEPSVDVRRDFVFDVGSSIEFSFRDAATHEPIAGVRALELQRDDQRSDELGRLVLSDALCPRCQVQVRFEHDDYLPHQIDLVGPQVAQTLALPIELERGIELGGIVTDRRDVPQPGLVVACSRRIRPRAAQGSTMTVFERKTMTDEHGRFRLGGLPPRGSFELSFGHPPDVDHWDVRVIGFELITLPEDARRTHWIVPDPVAIVGNVVDARGEPVAGLVVAANGTNALLARTAKTDEAGRFTIPDALPGAWILRTWYGATARVSDFTLAVRQQATQAIEVPPAGATHVEFRLAPSREAWPTRDVRIRVIDAVNGAALDEFDTLTVNGVDNTLSRGWYGRVREGPVLKLELPIGRYEITAHEQGYAVAWQLIDVEAGDGAQEFAVALESGEER